MLFDSFAVSSLLIASTLAAASPAPYKLGSMSFNNAFGLNKRQSGYQPTQTFCNPGDTCAEACGATYQQCASSDGDLHCYDPTIQQTCCPDGTGNSCDDGYYCTADSTGYTWCCPDGMSLTQCAAAYSLTGALSSEPATAAPTAALTSLVAATSAVIVEPPSTTAAPYTTSTYVAYSTYVASGTGTVVVGSNVTASSSAAPVQFTGGANVNRNSVLGGLKGLVISAGALLVF